VATDLIHLLISCRFSSSGVFPSAIRWMAGRGMPALSGIVCRHS
jgi:hypothetical protein